ncbi:McrC family protein [Galliscardovia ingluviei]|nr:McrC family protein [Galliscardovia ingluviei]
MLFELSLFLFPYYLKQALRKGGFKRYQHRMYNDGNIRGPIEIANHIKRNTVYTGKIAYSRRELSYDNELTELIRHTVEYVKGRPKICNILNRVQPEVKHIVEVTKAYNFYDRNKIIRENVVHPVTHAYYQEYVQLQQLCLSILRHTKHQFGTGNDQLIGILFDGAWLWEEYLNKLLSPYFHHPKNKSKEGKQHLFVHTAKGKDSEVGEVYPDFISRARSIQGEKNVDGKDIRSLNHVVADAKYKPVDHIYGRDYQQVLAYISFRSKDWFVYIPSKE